MATMTTAQFAEKLHTDPRTARKFLRSVTDKENQPGKGSRWVLDTKDLPAQRKAFKVWDEARRQAAATQVEDEA